MLALSFNVYVNYISSCWTNSDTVFHTIFMSQYLQKFQMIPSYYQNRLYQLAASECKMSKYLWKCGGFQRVIYTNSEPSGDSDELNFSPFLSLFKGTSWRRRNLHMSTLRTTSYLRVRETGKIFWTIVVSYSAPTINLVLQLCENLRFIHQSSERFKLQ